MEKRLDKIDKNIADLIEITIAVRDRLVDVEEKMATKVNLAALEKKVDEGFEGVNGKIEGLHRRMDAELEQKRVVEDRVSKIEIKVFPALAK